MKDKHTVEQPTFESIRQLAPEGQEYWQARDLQPLLEYAAWDKFKRVIEKAMEACRQSGHEADDHFSQAAKMVDIGSGAKREIEDYRLSRYACLNVQNGEESETVTLCHGLKLAAKSGVTVVSPDNYLTPALPAATAEDSSAVRHTTGEIDGTATVSKKETVRIAEGRGKKK